MPSHLRRRSCVIWRCCSAASRSSVGGIVGQPRVQDCEHLRGGLAGRADDEDAPELLLVLLVRCGECGSAWLRPDWRRLCSPADHFRLLSVAALALCSPMRGCESNACCQSLRRQRCHTLSEAAKQSSGVSNGRGVHHADGPGHAIRCRAGWPRIASSCSRRFQSSSVALTWCHVEASPHEQ